MGRYFVPSASHLRTLFITFRGKEWHRNESTHIVEVSALYKSRISSWFWDYMMTINHNNDIKEQLVLTIIRLVFLAEKTLRNSGWCVLRKLRKRPSAFVDPSGRLQLKPAEQAGNTKHLTCDVMIGHGVMILPFVMIGPTPWPHDSM